MQRPHTNPRFPYQSEFIAAVWCFLLAALAGAAMRFVGAGWALPEHIDFSNLRRAHSHLMLFGWVTPALFALIAAHAAPLVAIRRTLRVTLLLGLLSFPPFLLWGYGSAPIGDARVPLSVIVSTLSMFAWYAFAGLYFARLRRQLVDACGTLSVALWDGAMVLLVLGSAGAWARGALIGMKIDDRLLTMGVIEFFLSSFADGFLLLGVMGLLFSGFKARTFNPLARILTVAVPLEFLALLPVQIVPADMRIIGSVGVVIAGALTAVLGALLVTRGQRLAGLLLVVLGATKLLLAHPDVAEAIFGLGLRIPYLHVLLLGLVSLTLFEQGQRRWPTAIRPGPLAAAIAVMLLGLWPTTGLWPTFAPRELGLFFTALSSLAPVLVVVWMVSSSRRAKNPHHPVGTARTFEPVRPPFPLHHADEG